MTLAPLGDCAVVITLGDSIDAATVARVQSVAAAIARDPPEGVVDLVPAFASVAVFFDPMHPAPMEGRRRQLQSVALAVGDGAADAAGRLVEIPVSYGGEAGPDLESVAVRARLNTAQVVERHSAAEYVVHAIGFMPGFPYLGGLSPELATPRRASPRIRVPAGSVGIGGAQTGVYPLESPGGWNLIGRTPLRLFDVAKDPPALLRVGDRVRFRPVASAAPGGATEEIRPSRESTLAAASGKAAGEPRGRAARAGIEVLRAGLFTTVQDTGRVGHRGCGVTVSGAVDLFALRVANLLVGNPENAAALEITLVGPELKFLHDVVVAVGGGEWEGIPGWRPFHVAAGTVLKFGPARSGCRGYLAVAGGIDVLPLLGSRSTNVRAGFGGLEGRVLRAGDVLPVPAVRREIGHHWRIDERMLPHYSPSPEVRVVAGIHAREFPTDWATQLFRVTSRSDRMGLRLSGEAVKREGQTELISMPVAPGTVQVPPDGQPIVLLADAQTIGGYPQLAHVISVDLPLLAQLRPGDRVRFRTIDVVEACELALVRERAIGLLREGLAQKLA